MYTHLSRNNPYHLYNIKEDKIVRDDFKMSFSHPSLIKVDYIGIPNLSDLEINAIIVNLRNFPEYRDMVIGFSLMNNIQIKRIMRVSEFSETERVKKLLKFIRRDFNFVV